MIMGVRAGNYSSVVVNYHQSTSRALVIAQANAFENRVSLIFPVEKNPNNANHRSLLASLASHGRTECASLRAVQERFCSYLSGEILIT